MCVCLCVCISNGRVQFQKDSFLNKKKKTVSCALFNIIYFLYKSFVQNIFFFLFLVYLKDLKKKKIKLE